MHAATFITTVETMYMSHSFSFFGGLSRSCILWQPEPRRETFLADWHDHHQDMDIAHRQSAADYIAAIIERHVAVQVMTDLEQAMLADRLWMALRADYDRLARHTSPSAAFAVSLSRL